MERGKFGEALHELGGGLRAKVFALLAFSLVSSLLGGFLGYHLDAVVILPALLLALALILALEAASETAGAGKLAILYGITFLMGVGLGPVIAHYIDTGYGGVVIQAAVATALITAGLSAFALTTEADLSGWGGFLFAGLLALIGVSAINLFLGDSVLSLLSSWAGAVIFGLFLIYDVNRIQYTPDTMANAVHICLEIFLDIVNLFVNLIRILVEIAGDED